MSKKPRTKTKSGKPLLKSGKIAVPTVKRGEDGKLVGMVKKHMHLQKLLQV